MRALFIIHCQDPIYGASRSIGNFIRNFPGEADIVFPLNKTQKISAEQIASFYGDRVKNVWFMPQPARLNCIVGKVPLIQQIKSLVKDILYALAKPWYLRRYRNGGYDFIHLNSITLYPMLNPRFPMYLHVREPLRSKLCLWDGRLQQHLNDAHGVIFIGERYKELCPALQAPTCVLQNPFDQLAVGRVDEAAARLRYGIKPNQTVYAIIGAITPEKGVAFAIDAFRKAALPDAILLIVGKDTNNLGYEEQARERAGGSDAIRFLGQVDQTDMLYRAMDYVVRADVDSAPGRTVYEGLFSGCGALQPGVAELDLPKMEVPKDLEDRVHFYRVRDEADFIHAFQTTNGKRMVDRKYYETTSRYTEKLIAFVKGTL